MEMTNGEFLLTSVTLAFFCLGGLDLLQRIPQLHEREREAYVNWIYSQQLRVYTTLTS